MPLRKSLGIYPLLVLLSGCGVRDAVQYVPSGEMLSEEQLAKEDDRLPFGHSWIARGVFLGDFPEIFIPPVQVGKRAADEWIGSVSTFIASEQQYRGYVRSLAEYGTEEFRKAFATNDETYATLVDAPTNASMTVEIFFTEVTFGEPILHAVTTAIPVPAGSQIFTTVRNPTMSMEVIVRNSDSGDIIATFADKRTAPIRIVDLNKLLVTGANRDIISSWADELEKVLTRESKAEDVSRRFPFSLLPF